MVLSMFGCSRPTEASPSASSKAAPMTSPFRVDVSAAPCALGASCTATVTLTATDGFHINNEYPYKVSIDDAGGLDFSKSDFSKADGDFATPSQTTGVMTLRYMAKNRRNFRASGTFRLSVCSDDKCLLERPSITLNVPIP